MRSWVLHVDMDQFLAAVEILRRPDLAGLPVVVGGRGDPTERAVVSTASYEARQFGIRSGMPLKTAVRKCPDALFLPVDLPVYEAASAQVMDTLRTFPGTVVELLGWDEAFVGVDSDDPRPRHAHCRPRCWTPPGCTARSASVTPRSAPRSRPSSASRAASTG
jgi:DNA polymerase-4